MTTPMSVAAPDIHSTVRPPWRKRLNTSRPSASAPKTASLVGPWFGAATNSVGECGAKSGPNRAISRMKPTIPSPEAAGRVVDRALQIHGGRGYMRENLWHLYRDLRVDRIW